MNYAEKFTQTLDLADSIAHLGPALKSELDYLKPKSVDISELDAESTWNLVEQFNKLVALHAAGTPTPDFHIVQEAYGYSVSHDNWVRMLVVPSAAVGPLHRTPPTIELEDVAAAFMVALKPKFNQTNYE